MGVLFFVQENAFLFAYVKKKQYLCTQIALIGKNRTIYYGKNKTILG